MPTSAAAKPISVRIPPDLLEPLQALAADEGTTLSEQINEAVEYYLHTVESRKPSTLVVRSGSQIKYQQHYFNVRPERT